MTEEQLENLKGIVEDVIDFFKSFLERLEQALKFFDIHKGYETTSE